MVEDAESDREKFTYDEGAQIMRTVDESVESMESAPAINGFHLEPRCRVCRNDEVRTKVNGLLATGASYAMVLRALGDDNAKLEKGDQVTIDSIRNHTPGSAGCPRHLPRDPGASG